MRKLIAALAALLLGAAAQADTLIDNVNGYTIGNQGELIRFTGLVTGNDGRVTQLLQKGDRRPDRPDFRLDGKGRTLLPGMIDAHGHVMELGLGALSLDLSDTKSLEEAKAKIAAYAAANPSPRWITGFGWNQEKWQLGHFPAAADIDAVVSDRPVWLVRVDGHAGWANSLAMKEAGVTAASASPGGGQVEKVKGKPTGIFVDAARNLVEKAVPPPLPRVRDKALEAAQQTLLGFGVTATCDMGTDVDSWETMRRAGDTGRLQVRIISYGLGLDNLLAIAGTGPTPWLYDNRLRMIGVKFYADGALGSRGAWLKQPYKDASSQSGTPFHSDAEIRNLMSRAAMDHFQVAVHAIGDAANAQILGAIEELSDTYNGDRRWRIEHAQIVDPADLPRFAQHGIVASMQPTHETSDWRMAEARMGAGRLGGSYAWATMLQNHVPLAFGSDYPVESPNPFPGIAAAISREDAGGQPPGGWFPAQKVTLEQALAAFTRGGAYAGFADDRLGSLTPGHFADFIFVDKDPFQSDPAAIRDTKVQETWIGGRKVWERK